MNITRDQSSKWQRIADIPEEVFEAYIAEVPEISTASALREVVKIEQTKKFEELEQKDNYNT